MKKDINVGDAVDTGQGDYLHVAGKKINDNFSDIYHELGDSNMLFSAGSWKILNENDLTNGSYNAKFGQSLILNTTRKAIKINLPKGGVENIGKVIKLRDVFGTWLNRPVEVKPFSGDTIKGLTGYTKLRRNYSSVELVYTSSNRWEYVETTQIDQHRSEDNRSVVMSDFIAIEGQTDFLVPFDAERYNPNGIEVYRRGNKLYYGKEFSPSSEYGSIGPNGELIALDGITIKLRDPCVEGDSISFTSYIDGIETFRTSKNKRTFVIKDTNVENVNVKNDNEILTDDASYIDDGDGQYIRLSLDDLGIKSYDAFNPYTLDILLNGVMLTKTEDYGGGKYFCQGSSDDTSGEDNPYACALKGGEWVPYDRDADYNYTYEGASVNGLEFNFKFQNNDILTVIWYNNIIGTTLSIDDVRVELQSSFVGTTDEFHMSNQIRIPNYQDIDGLPTQKDVEYVQEDKMLRPSKVSDIMELVYPIGHIYMNLYNKFSPELTLGFGKWRRMTGYVMAGFSDDYNDVFHGQNNNFLDLAGKPTPTPGGTYGQSEQKLTSENIPRLKNDNKILVKDDDGSVDIGACLVDPDDEGMINPKRYSEMTLEYGTPDEITKPISNLQPTMVVSMWIRVA